MSDTTFLISGGFFDAVDSDRLYSADQMNQPYKKLIHDGINREADGTTPGFAVTAGGGMNVLVATGNAMIGGKWAENKAVQTIAVAGNTSGSARIDSIILQCDKSRAVRAVQIVYRQGTTAAPDLVSDDDITELRLANIRVPSAVSSIASENITDTRGGAECPWVRSVFDAPDARYIVEEYTGSELAGAYQTVKSAVDSIRYAAQSGQPTVALQASDMIDSNLVYLYQGSETGYSTGYLYYYSDAAGAWIRGAQYGASVVDTALDEDSENPVQNKAIAVAIKTVRSFVVEVPGSAAAFSGSIAAGDFAKALATYTAGSGVYAVKDGEVYQLSAASSSTMTFTQMYHGTMNFIKQIQITSADTFTVTNTALSSSAADTSYNNTTSGLTATDVQAAIDENAAAVTNVNGRLDDIANTIVCITTEEFEELSGTDTSGKTINYTETVTDAVSGYHVVTYSVLAGDKFEISGSAVSGGYLYIFTDGTDTIGKSDRNTTGGIANYTNISAVAPSGATTLIVAYNISSSYTHALVKKITGYSVDGLEELSDRIEVLEDNFTDVEELENVPSTDLTVHNDRFMFVGGGESSTTTAWEYVEYTVPTNATKMIVTAVAGQSARLWILKNASGTVLGYSSDDSSASLKTEIINMSSYTGATKLYVNNKKSGKISIQYIYLAKKLDGENIFVNGLMLDDAIAGLSPLYGKVLCCCGDSITYGADMDSPGITNDSNITVYQSDFNGNFSEVHTNFLKSWGYQIASRNNMTFYNGGVSGSTIQGEGGVNGFSNMNGRYTKLPDNIDYLLLWFGWNDNAYGTLGQITDDTNASYYGGYNVVLPYLIDKYPYAKIALIVPFGTTEGHRNAIRQLGNKWGVAVWDNYQGGTPLYFGKESSVGVEASIVTSNRAKFQANGAHPNYKGHKQLADMIEEWLKGI